MEKEPANSSARKAQQLPELWSEGKVAEYLGTTTSALSEQRNEGRLPGSMGRRLGGTEYYYRTADLTAWINSRFDGATDHLHNVIGAGQPAPRIHQQFLDYTVDEAANLLGIDRKQLLDLYEQGVAPGLFGYEWGPRGKVWFKRESVDRWLARMQGNDSRMA